MFHDFDTEMPDLNDVDIQVNTESVENKEFFFSDHPTGYLAAHCIILCV